MKQGFAERWTASKSKWGKRSGEMDKKLQKTKLGDGLKLEEESKDIEV
jgi:hypothetical protein